MPPSPKPASRRCKRPCAGCEARIRWPLRGAAQSVAKNGVCCSCGKRRLCRFLLALALAPGHALPPLHDGQVGGQKGVAHGLRERQAALEAAFGEVVVEDAANAALLVAVAVAKVFVAPRFEARVFVGAKGRQRALAGGVKVRAVFVKAVVRRQVHAAAKPADQQTASPLWPFLPLCPGGVCLCYQNKSKFKAPKTPSSHGLTGFAAIKPIAK